MLIMKRKTFSLVGFIFLVILAAGMSGCAGEDAEGAAEAQAAEAAEVVEVVEEPETVEEIEVAEELAPTGDPENGRIIYELGPEGVFELNCIGCHRLDDLGDYGPGFEGIAERASTRVPDLSAEEYLRQSIVDPEAYIVEGDWQGHAMPTTYGELYSEQDIADLIAFLLAQ